MNFNFGSDNKQGGGFDFSNALNDTNKSTGGGLATNFSFGTTDTTPSFNFGSNTGVTTGSNLGTSGSSFNFTNNTMQTQPFGNTTGNLGSFDFGTQKPSIF